MEMSDQDYSDYFKNAKRKRYRILSVMVISLLLATFDILFSKWTKQPNKTYSSLLMIIWGISVCSFLYWWGSWVYLRCPRCKKLAYITFWSNWPFSTKCRHCGLKID